jgi:short-subunit dehydrogenase
MMLASVPKQFPPLPDAKRKLHTTLTSIKQSIHNCISVMSNKLALVTGASAGIGKELARYHAKQGGDVILVARRKEALDALKDELEKEFSVKAHVFTADLSVAGSAEKLYDQVKKANHDIDILINNAGFGGHGKLTDRKLEEDLSMIMVNIVSLVALTHLFAADMAKKGGGQILNVGSTAGFMPGPNQATYFATKAFVNSFSQAVDQELRDKGVTSTVLCPGYVETEFAHVANLEGTQMVAQRGATAESVATCGYDAMMAKSLVIINETMLSIMLQWIIPLMPRRMVLKLGDDLMKK